VIPPCRHARQQGPRRECLQDGLWIARGQLDAAAFAVDELELLSAFDEPEPELSDFEESDFFSDELDDESSDLLFADPLDELVAASRLSVR
jgi:hypothetical protein